MISNSLRRERGKVIVGPTFQLRINLGKQHDKLFPRTLVLAVLTELAEIL